MGRFDRYMLSQLLVLFGFFALVLVMVYWVNRAVILFDQLIADGQSAAVFLEFTLLSLPNVIRLVLPIASFAAAVYVANRMASESEMIVAQATGASPVRLSRPVIYFGIIVACLQLALGNILVPMAESRLSLRNSEIAQNITARLLTEGRFLHPADGITFYIREITPEGALLDMFLSDTRTGTETTTYTAERAFLARADEGTKLVMFNGVAQNLIHDGERLSVTRFDDAVFDVGSLISTTDTRRTSVRAMATVDLLRADANAQDMTGRTAAYLRQEGHERIAQPLLALVSALVGFACLLVGGFSRFGFWKQIAAAIVLLVVIKSLDNTAANFARGADGRWPIAYAPVLFGLSIAGILIWWAGRPIRRRKTATTSEAAT